MIGRHFTARSRALTVATAIAIAGTAWITAQQPANTGAIQGTVTDDRGAPIAQAYVAVAGPDTAARSVLTNDEGRFVIANLPDGDVMLTASRRGYTSIAAGQRDIDLPGRPIGVAAGRPVQLTLVMPRAASIEGAVVTLPGLPPGVGINIYRERPGANAAGPSLVTWRSAFTSSGTYRLDNLPPGRYVVRAGRTFFGDTAALASATRITLAPGDARTGADIRVAPAPTGRLEVSVSLASGPPAANPQVWVFAKDNSLPDATRESVTRRADGLYVADALVPGRYDVIAMTPVRLPVVSTPARVSVSAAWAMQEVEIAPGAPVSLTLAPAPGRILSGMLRTDSRTAPGVSPIDRIGISVIPQDLASSLVSTLPGQIVDSVTPNGIFTLTGVPPGRYVLRLSSASTAPPKYAKAVTIDGRDVTDTPIDITSDISGIEIVVGERPGTIAGRLMPADGISPIQSAMVFSDQEQHWRRDSSRVQVAPLSTGRFSIRNLPAGGYLVAIVDESTAEAWSVADLTRLKTSAVAIAVSDGERTEVELRAANGRTTMVGTPATSPLAGPVPPVAVIPATTPPIVPPPARIGVPAGAPGAPPAGAPIPGAGSISGIVTDP